MAQMLSGWISLQRKIQSSFVWADSRVLKLWEICLFKASIKPTRFLFNGEEVSLDRGQFVTGRYTLRDEYNTGVKSGQQVSATSINRWMRKFRDNGMLDIRATNRYSVVTVLKYDEYQKVGQQVDSNRTSSGHQVDTLEQDLQDKQDNKTTTTDRQKVFNFFEQGGFGQLGSFQIQNIDEEIKDFTTAGSSEPEHMVALGLQEALNNNVRKWSYAKAVMHSWQDNKVLSGKDVEAYKASHKPAVPQPKPKDPSHNLPY